MSPFISPAPYIQFPTYWLITSLALCVTFIFFYRRILQKHLSTKIGSELFILILVTGFLGARIFHVLFEFPDYYYEYPTEIFKIWNGGFVFYGGFLVSTLCGLIYLKKIKQNAGTWLDTLAPTIALGYALGRIGCLMAGCCYGTPCDYPWAITFPVGVEAPALIKLHPTQLYATLTELIILTILLSIEKKGPSLPRGRLFTYWLILHGTGRLMLEHFRGDYRGFQLLGFSISTVVSTLIIGAGIMLLLKIKKSSDH